MWVRMTLGAVRVSLLLDPQMASFHATFVQMHGPATITSAALHRCSCMLPVLPLPGAKVSTLPDNAPR